MRNQRAFTLVEVMVVVIILGVISIAAVAGIHRSMHESRMRASVLRVQGMYAAAMMYEAINGNFYPSSGWLSLNTFNTQHGTNFTEYNHPDMTTYYTTGGSAPVGGFQVGVDFSTDDALDFFLLMESDDESPCCQEGACSVILPSC